MEKTEGRLQQELYMWFHNKYPELRGLLCYNLNNSKNKIDGALNKSKGLQIGRSDLVFYYKSNAYMIELKTESGRQSHAQREWQRLIETQGFKYYIARNKNEFKNIIKKVICQW